MFRRNDSEFVGFSPKIGKGLENSRSKMKSERVNNFTIISGASQETIGQENRFQSFGAKNPQLERWIPLSVSKARELKMSIPISTNGLSLQNVVHRPPSGFRK